MVTTKSDPFFSHQKQPSTLPSLSTVWERAPFYTSIAKRILSDYRRLGSIHSQIK
jgi:hypothetical protein